jgi:hypothetical protein
MSSMSQPLTVKIPHKLAKAEAMRRVRAALAWISTDSDLANLQRAKRFI